MVSVPYGVHSEESVVSVPYGVHSKESVMSVPYGVRSTVTPRGRRRPQEPMQSTQKWNLCSPGGGPEPEEQELKIRWSM